jgi:catechol 2,3-dioxygenase-like lactoylglutathione lyase family enzyme
MACIFYAGELNQASTFMIAAPNHTPSFSGCRVSIRSLLLPILILVAPVCKEASGASSSDVRPPLAVSGIAGASFLTADIPAIRRFYGEGAGLAEVPGGRDSLRFMVGNMQWLDFKVVPEPKWPRRLLYVTLEASNLDEVGSSLRARGISFIRISSETHLSFLQMQDPAGNLIRLAEPATAAFAEGAATPFSRHLQHVGFAVPRSKEEATVEFYREALGWPEVVRLDNPDGRLGLVKFRLPGDRKDLIELIFFDPPLNKWAAGAFDHINFEVNDINAAFRLLHRGGIASEPKNLPTVNGEHLWAINLFDPELTRVEIQDLAPTSAAIGTVSMLGTGAEQKLFDGKTLAGWEGNLGNWRVEDGAIVAGALDRKQPHNEFLATTGEFGNFELRLQYKVIGSGGFVNGGVQFWSQRVPQNFEVSGYQADLGANTDGNLYDESRRNRNLAVVPEDIRKHALKADDWNDYRIRANGPHIQIWLNGVKTVDFTESDAGIPQRGRFALQIHGGANTMVSYRGLTLEALP